MSRKTASLVSFLRVSTAFLLASSVFVLAGCGDSTPKKVTAESSGLLLPDGDSDEGDKSAAAAGKKDGSGSKATDPPADPFQAAPPARHADKPDPFKMPKDASPKELVEFVERLDAEEPAMQSWTREQRNRWIRRYYETRLTAAEAILAASPDEKQRAFAVEAKLFALSMLPGVYGPEDGLPFVDKLRIYAGTLLEDENAEIARLARLTMFQLNLVDLGAGKVDDSKPVMDELKQLMTEEDADSRTFAVGFEAVMLLRQIRREEESVEAMKVVGNAFKDDEDKELASRAAALLTQAAVLNMHRNLVAVMKGDEDTVPKLIENVKTILAPEDTGQLAFQVTMQAAQNLEYGGHTETAREVYGLIKEAFKDNEDANVAKEAARQVEMAERRMALLGKPFPIEGALFNGESFDWNAYKDKVVLVDFWATWCGPCMQELPNIRKNYERFHEKGFEVVGVNLDEERRDVENFFATDKLPWVTVVSADPEKKGFDDPNAVRYGVSGIPFLVLVGKDGNVAALHVRGDALGEKLEELLGPAEPVPEKTPDDKTPPKKEGPATGS